MTTIGIRELAEELYDNHKEVLAQVLQEVIDEQGWHQATTLSQAMQTHSKVLTEKIKKFKKLKQY